MHQQHVLIAAGSRSCKIGRLGDSRFKQPVVNELVFLGWKDVRSDRQITLIAVDKLEGQHGRLYSATHASFLSYAMAWVKDSQLLKLHSCLPRRNHRQWMSLPV